MTSVNSMGWSNWFAFVFQEPKWFYRRWQINFNQWSGFTAGGTNTGIGGNVNTNVTFRNMWFMYGGIGGTRSAFCSSCLRGGPFLRTDPQLNTWFGFSGDSRKSIVPGLSTWANARDGGDSYNYGVNPYFNIRVTSRFSGSLGITYQRNIDDRQWLRNYGDVGQDTTHYTVGHLSQETLNLTTRLNFTASPTLSFQFYGSPFVSVGEYSDWREVSAPRHDAYDSRSPFTLGGDPSAYDFSFKQFRSNLVMRWEYRPGSAPSGLGQAAAGQPGTSATSAGGASLRTVLGAPANTFLVKAYWFSCKPRVRVRGARVRGARCEAPGRPRQRICVCCALG
jgi:hypothetical protein